MKRRATTRLVRRGPKRKTARTIIPFPPELQQDARQRAQIAEVAEIAPTPGVQLAFQIVLDYLAKEAARKNGGAA